jgi:hypothetical protein
VRLHVSLKSGRSPDSAAGSERLGLHRRPSRLLRRGRELREIKMDLSSWVEKGFPLTFMLCTNDEGQPHVRALT